MSIFSKLKKRKKTKNENISAINTSELDEVKLKKFEVSDYIIPFYINTNRLTDIHAMLNEGYRDSVEWTQTTKEGSTNNKKGKINAGLKFFNYVDASTEIQRTKEDYTQTTVVEKATYTHTAASLLQDVLECIEYEKIVEYNKSIEDKHISEGNLICARVILHKPKGPQSKAQSKENISRGQRIWLKKLKKVYRSFNGIPDRAPAVLELVKINEKENDINNNVLADVTLSKDYLYQCELNDLWEMELTCLGKLLCTDTTRRIELVALFC